jgi:hypothetical protein
VFQSQLQKKTIEHLQATPTGREVVAHGGARLQGAILGGDVRQVATTLPVAARSALLDAYHAGFSSAFNSILIIGAVVALVGSIGSFALVRQRDFVPSVAPAGPPAGAGAGGGGGGGAGSTSPGTVSPAPAPAP